MFLSLRSLLFLVVLWTCCTANAALVVNIDKGNLKPAPFVISYFSKSDGTRGYPIDAVIVKDLVRSGFFKFIGYTTDGVEHVPNFAEYRNINSVLLISGEIKKTGRNSMDVYVRAWDVVVGKQVFGKVFSTKQSNWRRVGHLISDEIYKRITGNGAYFDSKIVYVSETGDFFHRSKRLAIADQDGGNVTYLTNGQNLVLTPTLSKNGENLLYVAYVNRVPRVMLYNLRSRSTYMVGNFSGMTYSPRFSPVDDDIIVLSATSAGSTNIHKLHLKRKATKQLTQQKGISTSPSFSPDGKKIAFVSDRTGAQQIFVMNSDGTNQRRISMGYGQYSTPAWSPSGEYIAFTKIEEREFFIGIMRPNGSDERLLAKGYMVEGPSWAPNSKWIVFTKELPGRKSEKSSKLYTVDISGRHEKVLDLPTDASDPSWSSLGAGYST